MIGRLATFDSSLLWLNCNRPGSPRGGQPWIPARCCPEVSHRGRKEKEGKEDAPGHPHAAISVPAIKGSPENTGEKDASGRPRFAVLGHRAKKEKDKAGKEDDQGQPSRRSESWQQTILLEECDSVVQVRHLCVTGAS
jgi:hypothetical protein